MTEEKNTDSEKISTRLIIYVIVVLLGGAVICFFGVNAKGIVVDSAVVPNISAGGVSAPLGSEMPMPALPSEKDRTLLAVRGQQLAKEQCSACHMLNNQFIGPSYNDIVHNNGDDHIDPLDVLVPEINHPSNRWSNYAPGPQLNLPSQDRLALACWIVQSVSHGGRQN